MQVPTQISDLASCTWTHNRYKKASVNLNRAKKCLKLKYRQDSVKIIITSCSRLCSGVMLKMCQNLPAIASTQKKGGVSWSLHLTNLSYSSVVAWQPWTCKHHSWLFRLSHFQFLGQPWCERSPSADLWPRVSFGRGGGGGGVMPPPHQITYCRSPPPPRPKSWKKPCEYIAFLVTSSYLLVL